MCLKSVQVEDSRGTQWKDMIKWTMRFIWVGHKLPTNSRADLSWKIEETKQNTPATHLLQDALKEIELPALSWRWLGTATLQNSMGQTASEEHVNLLTPWWTLVEASCFEEFLMFLMQAVPHFFGLAYKSR